jgi:lipopolysaccharide export system protein LptA
MTVIAGVLAVPLASLAIAQAPVSALKGHDPDAPIDVAADRIEVQDRSDRAVFAGNVHVRQAALTLDTERLTVAYSSAGGV